MANNAQPKVPAGDDPVGYGKPPQQHRFRKGQSGNPRGRPRGARNRPAPPALHEERLKSIILDEAYRPDTVKDANGPVTIPMAQAVVRSLAVNAAKGGQRAQRLFTDLLAGTERANKAAQEEFLQRALEYKRSWEPQLELRRKHSITAPDPIPHPDDVVVDLRRGTVVFKGPVTKEEKAELDKLRESICECHVELTFLRGELEREPWNRRCIEDVENEEFLAMKQFRLAVLTGADPTELRKPVRPPSVRRLSAKHRNRVRKILALPLSVPAADRDQRTLRPPSPVG